MISTEAIAVAEDSSSAAQATASTGQVPVLADDHGGAAGLHRKSVYATVAGDYGEAIRLLKMALLLKPNSKWLLDLGAVLYAGQRYLEAARAFLDVTEAGAGDGETWFNAGRSLLSAGHALKALRAYEKAAFLGFDPQRVALAKGIAFLRLKHPGQALRVLQPLYQADPLNLTTQNLMANAYIHLKQFDLAAKHCREADRIGNGARNVRENLFSSLWLTGEIEECLEIGRSLLPGASAAFHLSYLTAFDHFTPDPEASKAAWKEWDQLYNSSTSAVPRSVSSLHPERLLRVGYLVSEIHRFPDWHFVPPLFENRGRTAFYSIGYLTKSTSRGYLKTVSRCFELMRDVRQQTPEQAAKHIAGDQVDILVNPCWDHRGHHLQIFAHRPAAIQIEIPLYPGTTGAAATDFIFTDPWVCPDGAESIYRERVYRLVESYVPWQPPPKAPDPSAAPIERNGYCTFGIFQKPIKLNSFVWDAVAEILRRAGDARLLMHQDSRDLDDESSGTRNRYVAVLARLGIRPERISFVGSRRLPQHYSVVSQVDIALDTFPYSGMTTTGDCLWMGVPVITYAGRTHASRVSHSMLTRLGFPELVAHSVAEYADKAVNLANNAKRIGVLRRELRDRMRNSHLTSGKAVMRGIEMAYRQIWRDYCAHKLELKEKI